MVFPALVPIAIGLASKFLPDLVGKLAGDKAEQVAEQVVNVAKVVTGIDDPAQAAEAIQASPELQLKFTIEANRHREEWKRLELEEWREENRQFQVMDGTAADLAKLGWVGKIVLFFRSLQRPLWCYLTMYIAFKVFSKAWPLDGEIIQQAFYLNLLMVLIVVLGERAIKNVVPVLSYFFPRFSGNKKD